MKMSEPKKKDGYRYINVIAVVACFGVIVIILTVLFADFLFERATSTVSEGSYLEISDEYESSDDISYENSTVSEVSEEFSQSEPTSTEESEESSVQQDYTTAIVNRNDVHRGNLILVNTNYQFDFDNVSNLVQINKSYDGAYEKYNDSFGLRDSDMFLAEKIMKPFSEMVDGLHDYVESRALTITSSYRSKEEQQEQIDKGKDNDIVGASDLHTGLSFICTVYPSSEGKLTEGKFLWLSENCYKYGFVLRYPSGKEDITGHSSASNHFRYVGVPHAYLMSINKMPLEEYIDFCKSYSFENPYSYTYESHRYLIYYTKANEMGNTEIKIPKNCTYSISGDNIEGFIVTVDAASETH